MKTRVVTLLLLMSLVPAALAAGKAAPIRKDYKADLVAPDVYVIHGPREVPNPENQGFMNNPSFIVTGEGVVVVDPGASVQTGEMVLDRIAAITDKPVVAVLNTHVHGDHWLGNQAIRAAYPAAKIYGHKRMAEEIEKGAGLNWVDLMMRLTEGATDGTRVVGPDQLVDDGDVVRAGGLTFRIMHNDRAHTHTDIMAYVVEKNLIYLGDNAGHLRILRLDHGSFRGNIQALDNAVATGATVFVPGHGPTGGTEAALEYRDYLKTVYETVRQGYEDGKADFEIRPALLPKLDAWKEWAGFDTELGTHISEAFLEAEAADFE